MSRLLGWATPKRMLGDLRLGIYNVASRPAFELRLALCRTGHHGALVLRVADGDADEREQLADFERLHVQRQPLPA